MVELALQKRRKAGKLEVPPQLSDPVFISRLRECLGWPANLEVAGRLLEVPADTLRTWLARGRRAVDKQRADPDANLAPDERHYAGFYARVKLDVVYGESRLAKRIAGRKPLLLLSRRFRQRWGRPPEGENLRNTTPRARRPSSYRVPTPGEKRGRPTRCDSALTAEFCLYIEQMIDIETAAALCGLDRKAVYAWLERGRAELDRLESEDARCTVARSEEPYVEFSDKVRRALASVEARLAVKLREKSTEVFLERRFPERWGKSSTHPSSLDEEIEFFEKQQANEDRYSEDTSELRLEDRLRQWLSERPGNAPARPSPQEVAPK